MESGWSTIPAVTGPSVTNQVYKFENETNWIMKTMEHRAYLEQSLETNCDNILIEKFQLKNENVIKSYFHSYFRSKGEDVFLPQNVNFIFFKLVFFTKIGF